MSIFNIIVDQECTIAKSFRLMKTLTLWKLPLAIHIKHFFKIDNIIITVIFIHFATGNTLVCGLRFYPDDSYSTEESFLQDFLAILKRMLQNC